MPIRQSKQRINENTLIRELSKTVTYTTNLSGRRGGEPALVLPIVDAVGLLSGEITRLYCLQKHINGSHGKISGRDGAQEKMSWSRCRIHQLLAKHQVLRERGETLPSSMDDILRGSPVIRRMCADLRELIAQSGLRCIRLVRALEHYST